MAMKAMKAAKAVAPPKAKSVKAMKAAKAVAPPKAMKRKGAKAMKAAKAVAPPKAMKAKTEWKHVDTTNVRECWVETEYVTKKPPIVRVWKKD